MNAERNPTTITGVFALVAVALATTAYFTQPAASPRQAGAEEVGARFFPELTLEAVKGLEVTDYDPKAATNETFRVEYEKGGWVLPLKDGYPADAKDAVAKATAWLTSVSRDVMLTADKGQHKELGVLNPADEKGSDGVGILFRALDENKNVIAELVVGKEVEGKSEWRYVREPKSDAVYRAEVGDFSVSTRFSDWIEKDLLELSDSTRTTSDSTDADRAKFKKTVALVQWTDFNIDQQSLKVVGKKSETLKFTGGSEWSPQAELEGLAAGRETNQDKVRDLNDALRNLQIVEVLSKPAGLGPDLKLVRRTGRVTVADKQVLDKLMESGFIPIDGQDVAPVGGELRVETKEGIVYRLRFGELAMLSKEGKIIGNAKAPTADKKDKGKNDPGETKSQEEVRFVLIAAEFDASKFPPIADPPAPEIPAAKPGEKTDPAQAKKQAEELHQFQKAQTEQARKKREKDIENGKLRAKELTDRYDRWYYLVSNDAYKKMKIDKAAFSKVKEEKKDDKQPTPAGLPGLPDDLMKSGSKQTLNPNVPMPEKEKSEPKKSPASPKESTQKEPDSKSPSSTAKKPEAIKPLNGPGSASPPAKEAEKPKDSAKPTDDGKAKKPHSP
jgi:hypothetical protein